MKSKWVERAVIAALTTALGSETTVVVPGAYFRDNVEGKEWVEPGFGPIERPASAARVAAGGGREGGTRAERWTIPIRCVVKSQPKGAREYVLSELVDRVRAVVDATEGAGGLQLLDDSDPQVCAGALTWSETQETRTREYGTAILMPGGHTVKGVDVAYLEARAVVGGRL